ncbi:hypothetical protein QE152_g13733 [Popillia japonica]|uniref:Retropepsins domain-containing protein n=1 Tax=Popillia japonica TaxID=7064 RepID=A0AAW1LBP0_POPJA
MASKVESKNKTHYCKSKRSLKQNEKHINEINSDSNESLTYIDSINLDNVASKNTLHWTIDISINNHIIPFKLDTGAGCNCLPINVYKSLNCKNEIIRESKRSLKQNEKHINEINSDSNESLTYIDSINLDNVASKNTLHWTIDISINNHIIPFKLDTGAGCNCLPINVYKSLNCKNEIIRDSLSIIAYGNNKITTRGSVVLKSNVKGTMYNIKYVLVKTDSSPILGLNGCKKLNLVQKIDNITDSKTEFITKNTDVFSGSGKIPFQYKIKMKQNCTPYQSACRRVPDTIKPLLKKTLDNLVEKDIIEQTHKATEWANNIVIVEKPNKKLRICLDPLHLNESIVTDKFPII